QLDRQSPPMVKDVLMSSREIQLRIQHLPTIPLIKSWAKKLLFFPGIQNNPWTYSVFFLLKFGSPRQTSFLFPFSQLFPPFYNGPEIPCLRIRIKCTASRANSAAGRKNT